MDYGRTCSLTRNECQIQWTRPECSLGWRHVIRFSKSLPKGAGTGKRAAESELLLWPHHSYDTMRRIAPANRVIAYGRAVLLREGYLHEGLQHVRASPPSFFRVQYTPPNNLAFTWVPDSSSLNAVIFDGPGPILDVHTFEAGVLTGRWIDGGIAMLGYPTPVGLLMEKAAGYFCAWPFTEPRG